MIKSFKIFESEIYVGTNKHYNQLRPANVELVEEPKKIDYICNDCFCEFIVNSEITECSICGSENIKRLLI